MSKYIANKNRECHICGDIENREATEYELMFMIAIKWMKDYKDGKWTGKYICSRCKSRNNARRRHKKSKEFYTNNQKLK